MSKKQLRQLPSVSEVLLKINKSIALHDRYIMEIIKSELSNPPRYLSKSLNPVGTPVIFPSFLYDVSIILRAALRA